MSNWCKFKPTIRLSKTHNKKMNNLKWYPQPKAQLWAVSSIRSPFKYLSFKMVEKENKTDQKNHLERLFVDQQ